MSTDATTVAIACQGGGSHTAFTAGVLSELLENFPENHELVGLSGTSGGALCASLAWVGLASSKETPRPLLESFWSELAASTPLHRSINTAMLAGAQLQRLGVPFPDVSPAYSPGSRWGEEYFRDLLRDHIDFEAVPELINEETPALLVSAVDVKAGTFRIFREEELSANAILASAAIPTLFEAIEVNENHYWDGLFSKNPPMKDFVTDDDVPNPDEIWLIKINPQERDHVPTSPEGIADRRNELGGNLSLNAEISFIETINRWIDRSYLPEKFTHTEIRRIRFPKTRRLDWRTKLDRDPQFIERLYESGERQAHEFLDTFEATTIEN